MSIPTTGLVSSYDPLDPTSYSPLIPTVMADTVGSCNLNLANLTYNSTNGTLTSTTLNTDYGRSSNGTYPPITLTNNWSASIWVKPNTVSTNIVAFAMGCSVGGGNGVGYYLVLSGGGTSIDHSTVDVTGEAFSFSWNASTWYNFTITYDGTTNPGTPVLKLYANGTLIRTLNWGIRDFSLNASNSNLSYNGWLNSTQLTSPPFFNDITKGPLQIWNVTLNSTQVNDVYLNDVGRFSPPLHEYDFADPASYSGSGSTVYDIGSSPINLSVNNATFNGLNDTFTLQGSSSSYIRSAEPVSIGIGTNNFSYQLWYQFNGQSTVNDCQLQVGSRGGSTFGGCNFATVGGQLIVEAPGVSGWNTGFYPTAGQWYLLSLTVNGSNLNTLYVDGVSFGTTTQAYNPLGAIASIAMGPAVTNLGDSSLSGYGALQIYDRVISSSEITNYYNGTFYRFNPGKVYLNASEPASASSPYTTWNDLSNSYDFTMYNPSFTPVSTDPAYYSFPSRNFGDPLTVYGEYNGTPAVTSTNNFTGYFWVRRNANHGSFTQNRLSIFANGREDLVGGDNGWSYGTYNNPNAANDNVVIERAGFGIIDSGYSFADATWINIAITVNSSNVVTFYQDGNILGGPGFSFSATTPADGMWISRTAGSFFSWMGDISIIRQYDYALTQAQIQELYAYDYETYITPTPPPPPPPVGIVGGRTFGQGFAG